MEKWSTIKKLEDGTRVEIETSIQTTHWENYKITWIHSVKVCGPKKRTWLLGKEGKDYTQEDLRAERLKYVDNLKKEI